ncbi:MAG: PIN domain-containing protein [Bacteroidota bacterium]
MDNIFLDADIVLDFLAQRKPFHPFADQVFQLSDEGKVTLYVSSLTFSHVHYILGRQLGKGKARQILKTFKVLVKVVSVGDKVIDLALASSFKDFEDAIQHFTALEVGCSVILTRNISDYKQAQLPVMTAESYIKLSN